MTKQNLPSLFDKSLFNDANFGSLFDNSVGLDQFFGRVFDDLLPAVTSVKYPPWNIRKDDDHTRTIEMALAGYGENDIEVLVDDDTLIVRGNKVANIGDTNVNYIYQGVAARKFERKFVLGPGAVVSGATMKDGMLNITVTVQEPENVEVKRIPVNAAKADPTET